MSKYVIRFIFITIKRIIINPLEKNISTIRSLFENLYGLRQLFPIAIAA